MIEIPKIIHYCWFGENQIPDLAVKCIESWKKYFPDYEIKEWNESNFDFNICNYSKEAYQAEKWAFVSDYARFWILYHEGGLYFDTDVEVIRSFSDIVGRGAFMGSEKNTMMVSDQGPNNQKIVVNPGLGLGVAPGIGLYKEILKYYEKEHFGDKSGKSYVETVVTKTTNILISHGYDPYKKEIQNVAGIWIYPPEYFSPIDYSTGLLTVTPDTHSIHCYMESWLSEAEKKIHNRNRKINSILGERVGSKIGWVLERPYYIRKKIKEEGLQGSINRTKEILSGK